MTISFLQLDHDCPCLAPGLVNPAAQCQDCQTQVTSPSVPLSPLLQCLLDLKQDQITLSASVIVLNGAWEPYRASLGEPWAQIQARIREQATSFSWPQAAQQLQAQLPELPSAELEPLMQALQAWDSGYVRLTPYLSHPNLDQSQSADLLSGLVVAPHELGSGFRQLFGALFQSRYLIQWQHHQINPLDLGLEVLIQPVVPCLASGHATLISGAWQIMAGPGLPNGEVNIVPDPDELDAATFKLQPAHRGQELTLSDQHWENLHQLCQAIPQSLLSEPYCYGWQIPLVPGLAQITQIRPCPPEPPATSYQLNLTTVGTGIVATPNMALAPALVITGLTPPPDFSQQVPGYILVVVSFNPEWLPGLRAAVGLVCERGGLTSHGAILARELGLPAVIGVADATQRIQSGDVLYLDGQTGQVAQVNKISSIHQPSRPIPQLATPPRPQATSAPTGHPQLYVNLSQAQALGHLPTVPIAGIGLLRSENIFLEQLAGRHPALWFAEHRQAELQQRFKQSLEPFFAAFSPRPIFYRSLDLRSHELRGLVGGNRYEPEEENPVLGLRGLARSCLHPELFHLELATLQQIHDSHPGPIRFVLPFVRRCEEVAFCQEQLNLSGLLNLPDFELWVMAEVPGILFILPELVGLGVKGISIGSNDLTQLLLGVDREQAALAQQFTENHPAVKAAITQLIRTAQNLGLACSLCGEAVSVYPDWVAWLAGLGIDGISVTPEALQSTEAILQQIQPSPVMQHTKS